MNIFYPEKGDEFDCRYCGQHVVVKESGHYATAPGSCGGHTQEEMNGYWRKLEKKMAIELSIAEIQSYCQSHTRGWWKVAIDWPIEDQLANMQAAVDRSVEFLVREGLATWHKDKKRITIDEERIKL